MDWPVLHAVTDDALLADPSFPDRAREVLDAAGPAVALHLRGPATAGALLYRRAGELREVAASSGAWLVVNDRVDVAGAVEARAVQLGQRSLPVEVARRLFDGPVGVSVHDESEARAAAGADWLTVGTLFETPSHPGRPGVGVGILGRVAAAAPGVKLVGIGGITPSRVPAVREAGAHGVAVMRGIWESESPARAAGHYLTAWQDPPTTA